VNPIGEFARFIFKDICIEQNPVPGCSYGKKSALFRKEKKHEQRRFSQQGFQGRKKQKGCSGSHGLFLSSILKALEDGNSVSLVGFGTFKVSDRKARKGRNPQTGEEIDIPASKVPKFVAGKALKEAVKQLFVQR